MLLEADFLPTDRVPIGHADITVTNPETDASYLQRSRHKDYALFVESTGSWEITVVGSIWTPLYPGEPPSGVVQEPGLWIMTDGRLEYTLDQNDVLTAFSLEGRYTHVCAGITN